MIHLDHESPSSSLNHESEGQKEASSSYWFLQLELPSTPEQSRELILGRYDRSSGSVFNPDINLIPYDGKENRVSPKQLRINLSEQTLGVFPEVIQPTFLNGRLLQSEKLYSFLGGDVLKIGRIQILLQLLPAASFLERKHHLVVMKSFQSSVSQLPAMFDLAKPVLMEELGCEYPAWIVQRIREVNALVGSPLEQTLQIVLMTIDAERNIKDADPNGPVRAMFIRSNHQI